MSQPNILFLFSDEHSFRFMGHIPEQQGGEPDVQTPNLDRLARQGTVFTDTYCQMPLCTPSRISMLTGLEAKDAGAWGNSSILRPELNTIPRTLQENGYETCLVGKMHLGGRRQFAGFRHRPYGDLTGDTGHQWEPVPEPAMGMRSRTKDAVGRTGIPESLMQERVITQESLSFLREHTSRNPDQPWFLCASFSRPHFPLTAPRRWIDRYPPDRITRPKVDAGGDAHDHPMSVKMREGFRTDEIEGPEMMNARSAYFACVSYLDEIIGDMLLQLEANGFLENTIIVYSTDHGELAGEHGMWWKHSWHEGCTRVPLITSTPEQRKGEAPPQQITTPVALLDLYPTFCGLSNTPKPPELHGCDLTKAVREGREPPDRPIVSDNLIPRWGEGTEFRSVRQGRYKYVRFRNVPPLFFDLEADPEEHVNLIQRGIPPQARSAYEHLKTYAEESLDFDEAERLKKERDEPLAEKLAIEAPNATGNLYVMPNGTLVNADDPLYNPTVITNDLQHFFCDMEE